MLNCELEGASVVLVGNFNPSIFQPAWLSAQGIIRANEGKEADVQVISSQITSFSVDWLVMQVLAQRFAASTVDSAHFEALRDLVVHIFTILEHTPLKQMGINREMHYRMPDEETWHAVGNTLAPKEKWESLVEKPGMENVTITGTRAGSSARFRVSVQPSVRVRPGVYISTNEHFVADGADAGEQLIETLKSSWSEAQKYSKGTAETLLNRIIK
ncbi:MAG: hypothetical protein WA005_00860 [Candidatus Binataceae bacterium]